MLFAELERAVASAPERPPLAVVEVSQAAAPGVMRLTAVRDRSGCIVDFVFDAANAAAARMMYCTPSELTGKHLLAEVAGPLGHPVLVERYRRVITHGNVQSFEQVHLLDGTQDIVVHRVMRDGDAVVITLTNLSADRRAQERRLHSAAWSDKHALRAAA